jgi:hypothetical protein
MCWLRRLRVCVDPASDAQIRPATFQGRIESLILLLCFSASLLLCFYPTLFLCVQDNAQRKPLCIRVATGRPWKMRNLAISARTGASGAHEIRPGRTNYRSLATVVARSARPPRLSFWDEPQAVTIKYLTGHAHPFSHSILSQVMGCGSLALSLPKAIPKTSVGWLAHTFISCSTLIRPGNLFDSVSKSKYLKRSANATEPGSQQLEPVGLTHDAWSIRQPSKHLQNVPSKASSEAAPTGYSEASNLGGLFIQGCGFCCSADPAINAGSVKALKFWQDELLNDAGKMTWREIFMLQSPIVDLKASPQCVCRFRAVSEVELSQPNWTESVWTPSQRAHVPVITYLLLIPSALGSSISPVR